MHEVRRGDVWWADLPEPRGSEPGFRRPVVVIQSDYFNESEIKTVLCASLTSNLRLANAPGNVLLPARESGLDRDSAINVSQLVALDRAFLLERVTALPPRFMREIEAGLRLILSL